MNGMTRERVAETLRNYRRNVSRWKHLQVLMEEYERWAEEEEQKAMAEDALRGHSLTGMPRAGGTSSPVEDLVGKYMDGYVPPMVRGLREEIEAMRKERESRRRCIRYVDGWLECLPTRERTVIEKQMIEGLQWSEVEKQTEIEFGIPFSRAGLKRMKERGLAKIYAVAGVAESA